LTSFALTQPKGHELTSQRNPETGLAEPSADGGVSEALHQALKLLPHDATVHGMLAKRIYNSALFGDTAAHAHALDAARRAIASNPTAAYGWGVLAELFAKEAAERVAVHDAPGTELAWAVARIACEQAIRSDDSNSAKYHRHPSKMDNLLHHIKGQTGGNPTGNAPESDVENAAEDDAIAMPSYSVNVNMDKLKIKEQQDSLEELASYVHEAYQPGADDNGDTAPATLLANAGILRSLARSFSALNLHTKAAQIAVKAVRLDKESVDSYVRLGLVTAKVCKEPENSGRSAEERTAYCTMAGDALDRARASDSTYPAGPGLDELAALLLG
jgi:hypothetical protein